MDGALRSPVEAFLAELIVGRLRAAAVKSGNKGLERALGSVAPDTQWALASLGCMYPLAVLFAAPEMLQVPGEAGLGHAEAELVVLPRYFPWCKESDRRLEGLLQFLKADHYYYGEASSAQDRATALAQAGSLAREAYAGTGVGRPRRREER